MSEEEVTSSRSQVSSSDSITSTEHIEPETRPWQVISKRVIYDSPWIGIQQWHVRLPDGSEVPNHHVVHYPRQAACAVPVGADGRILLLDHYRFMTDSRGWEVPAGGIEASETPEQAALRELIEETGHSATSLHRLGEYHPSNGSSNQVFHVYVARDLQCLGEAADTNETLDLRWFTPAEVRQMILDNQIPDGFSITSLLWAFLAGEIGQ